MRIDGEECYEIWQVAYFFDIGGCAGRDRRFSRGEKRHGTKRAGEEKPAYAWKNSKFDLKLLSSTQNRGMIQKKPIVTSNSTTSVFMILSFDDADIVLPPYTSFCMMRTCGAVQMAMHSPRINAIALAMPATCCENAVSRIYIIRTALASELSYPSKISTCA